MEDIFAFELGETTRLIRREMGRRASVLGLTRAQWRVLGTLHRTGGGARQVELAERLDMEPITLCRVIDRLADAGLVERRRDPADRRAWLIFPTEKAAPISERLIAIGRAFDADLMDGIAPEEQAVASRLLARLRENLTAMDDERGKDQTRAG